MNSKILKTDPLFADFSEEELKWVSEVLIERDIEQGHTIIKEGETGLSLYILESGSVDIMKRTPDGESPTLSTIMGGSIFGEIALMGKYTRSADVVARDKVKVFELTYDSMEKLAANHPSVGLKIYRVIARNLIEKIKKTTDDLISIVVSSRIAAIGEMASGIAHEINTPLTVIRMHAENIEEMAQSKEIEPPTVAHNAGKILSMVDRISKLIQSVKALSRNSESDPMTKVTVAEIIDQTLELCQTRYKTGSVKLIIEMPSYPIDLVCRPIQVSQVVLNLLNNAYDAVKDDKERWVRLSLKEDLEDIEIKITDSGPGIPEDVRKRLFQSFFTTKKVGQGTGLGLSISQRIVHSHGGTLQLDEASPNTSFVIRLPKKGKVNRHHPPVIGTE